jgi:hypothetical protein
MQAKYPIFLKENPRFMGLSFFDLALLGAGLVLGMLLELEAHLTGVFIISFIAASKLLSKFVDLKALILAKKVRSYSWTDKLRRIIS